MITRTHAIIFCTGSPVCATCKCAEDQVSCNTAGTDAEPQTVRVLAKTMRRNRWLKLRRPSFTRSARLQSISQHSRFNYACTVHRHIHIAPVPSQLTAFTAKTNRREGEKETKRGQNNAVTPTANVVHTAAEPLDPVKLRQRQQARGVRLPVPVPPPALRPTLALPSPTP